MARDEEKLLLWPINGGSHRTCSVKRNGNDDCDCDGNNCNVFLISDNLGEEFFPLLVGDVDLLVLRVASTCGDIGLGDVTCGSITCFSLPLKGRIIEPQELQVDL